MKTTLDAHGQIGIPEPIRTADHLRAGDAFELERLTPGCYVISKQPESSQQFQVLTGEDGLPLIRVAGGVISGRQVKELEALSA